MCFLAEVVQYVLCDFLDAQRVKKSLLIFRGTEFFLVGFGFQRLKLRADIVIVHLKLQHLFITNGIGNHVRM
ncbi:Uncharacterised protein [Klebsiella pneumoniae]|nr:Uncharacterised protein [Klebsiella pneumoniae]